MTNAKTTRRALFSSVVALVLCFTMLMGTTFAWFTDSVSSVGNTIQSGTLDIVLEMWDGTEWVDAEGEMIPFVAADGREEILWEPGATYEMAPIRVRNVGNLAAYVVITINGIDGDAKLLETIDFETKVSNIPDSVLTGSQASVYLPMEGKTFEPMTGTPDGTVLFDWTVMGKDVVSPNSGHTDTTPEFTFSGHMDELAGNEYQGLSIEGISITVIATQSVYEYDSFGREYDKNATLPDVWNGETEDVPAADNDGVITLTTAGELAGFAYDVNVGKNSYSGKTVKLGADIDLGNVAWTPIGQTGSTQFRGTFDGAGYTISNLYIDSSAQTGANYSSGIFGWLNSATVKNVNVENATIIGHHNVGVIAGYLETSGCTIENCHVTNATISCTSANDDANGDKCGVIVGHAGNTGVVVKDCSATDCTVSAGRDAGQIAGAAKTANVTGCTATNVTVTANGTSTGANINEAIIGRVL